MGKSTAKGGSRKTNLVRGQVKLTLGAGTAPNILGQKNGYEESTRCGGHHTEKKKKDEPGRGNVESKGHG